jgi:hypothetical protein
VCRHLVGAGKGVQALLRGLARLGILPLFPMERNRVALADEEPQTANSAVCYGLEHTMGPPGNRDPPRARRATEQDFEITASNGR